MRTAPAGVTADDDLDVIARDYAVRWVCAGPAAEARLRAELIDRMLPFARRLAHRYRRSSEALDDLEQVAYLGLVKTVGRYHPEQGSFTAFAVATIGGELKRHFRDHTWVIRAPRRLQQLIAQAHEAENALRQELGRTPTEDEIAARCEADPRALAEARLSAAGYRVGSLSAPVGDGDGELADLLGCADPGFDKVADCLAIARLVPRLPPRVCRMLTMRFYEERTQAEIAAELGMSQMHVSRLLSRAFGWLREALLTETVPPWPGNDPDPIHDRLVVATAGEGVTEARVFGEVDRDTASRLYELLRDALRRVAPGGRLVVDLSGVPLLCAAGARSLRGVAEAARAHGVSVALTGARPHVRQVAVIAGLRPLLAS